MTWNIVASTTILMMMFLGNECISAAAAAFTIIPTMKHQQHKITNRLNYRAAASNHQTMNYRKKCQFLSVKERGCVDSRLAAATTTGDDDVEGDSIATVDTILSEIHSKSFLHRIVVIGNGAILETTSILGPTFVSSKSPKTGERLVTFASEDKSFEFHLKVEQVSKISFSKVDKPLPGGDGGTKTLRVCRFVNLDGAPMCSLILVDSSEEAISWFGDMIARFGDQVDIS